MIRNLQRNVWESMGKNTMPEDGWKTIWQAGESPLACIGEAGKMVQSIRVFLEKSRIKIIGTSSFLWKENSLFRTESMGILGRNNNKHHRFLHHELGLHGDSSLGARCRPRARRDGFGTLLRIELRHGRARDCCLRLRGRRFRAAHDVCCGVAFAACGLHSPESGRVRTRRVTWRSSPRFRPQRSPKRSPRCS